VKKARTGNRIEGSNGSKPDSQTSPQAREGSHSSTQGGGPACGAPLRGLRRGALANLPETTSARNSGPTTGSRLRAGSPFDDFTLSTKLKADCDASKQLGGSPPSILALVWCCHTADHAPDTVARRFVCRWCKSNVGTRCHSAAPLRSIELLEPLMSCVSALAKYAHHHQPESRPVANV
jgi:hypothetical protein